MGIRNGGVSNATSRDTMLMGAIAIMCGEATENVVGIMGSMTAEWRSVGRRMVIRAASGYTKLTELMMGLLGKCFRVLR